MGISISGQPNSKLTYQQIKQQLTLKLISFGMKATKEWPKADLYLDCRALPEPDSFKSPSGDHLSTQDAIGIGDIATASMVQAYFQNPDDDPLPSVIGAMLSIIAQAIAHLQRRRAGEDPFSRPFVVAFFCAHGIHRSRSGKNIIADDLKKLGYNVEVQ